MELPKSEKLFPVEWEAVDPRAFIINNNICNENGSPVEFSQHRFLIEPYADMAEEQVAIKAAQVGWSVMAINKALWLPKFKGANVIYTLPSKSVVRDFVTPKVDPIINNNPIYQQFVGGTDSTALKSIGDRFVYFRGSWEEAAAISISAHVLINDELDRSNQKVINTYKTRLDDAKRERPDLGFVWKFSNPSIPGYGVDEAWQESDQKHWFVLCPHCGYEWYLKWPDNINIETEQYICAKCHGVLSDSDRNNGRWVAKYPGRKISGYWVSQMMCTWHSAAKIIKDSKGDQQTFHNFTLGLPYISKDTSVSRQTIINCLVPGANKLTNVAMGVDNGVTKTVVIGNSMGIFKTYETDDWEDVVADIKRYNAYCVIDALPYPRMPIKLTQQFHGRVFVHYWANNKKTIGIIEWGKGDKQYVVESDRTKLIDMLVGELNDKDVIYNLTPTDLEQYISDWGQLYRVIETNHAGIQTPVWRTIEGRRDHYAFATMYWRIAMEKTYTESGVIRTALKRNNEPDHPTIAPDGTMPAVDPKEILRRSLRKGKDWRTR